ncbi:MAG: type II secretion system protein GspL [Pseudomonadota bacterium]
MKERLFIRLGVQLKDPIDWCVMGNDGVTVVDTGRLGGVHDLLQLAEPAKSRQIVCMVPGTEMLMTSVNFPIKQRRQIRKALPFMLEEQLVENIDDCHFALPAKITDDKVPVVVVNHRKMQSWMELFEAAQIEPDYLVPDCLSLPLPQKCWSALCYDDIVLARTSEHSAWACEQDMFAPMMQLHLQKQADALEAAKDGSEENDSDEDEMLDGVDATQDMLVYGNQPHLIETLQEMGVNVEVIDVEVPITVLAESFKPDSVNLLQSQYTLKQDYMETVRLFKPAAIVASVFLALHFVSLTIESMHLKQQYTANKALAFKSYKEVFPKARRVKANGDRIMKSELRKHTSGNSSKGFFHLLQDVYPGFKSSRGEVKPSALVYDKEKSEMRLDINAANIQTLESFKEFVIEKGYEAKLANVSQRDQSYRGRLTLKGQ